MKGEYRHSLVCSGPTSFNKCDAPKFISDFLAEKVPIGIVFVRCDLPIHHEGLHSVRILDTKITMMWNDINAPL
jgi:hypothetical protein